MMVVVESGRFGVVVLVRFPGAVGGDPRLESGYCLGPS